MGVRIWPLNNRNFAGHILGYVAQWVSRLRQDININFFLSGNNPLQKIWNRKTQLSGTQFDKMTMRYEYWEVLSPPSVCFAGEFSQVLVYCFFSRYLAQLGLRQLGLPVPKTSTKQKYDRGRDSHRVLQGAAPRRGAILLHLCCGSLGPFSHSAKLAFSTLKLAPPSTKN